MAVSQKNSDLTIDSSVRESISSLMDNAAQPLELQRVLKASDNDEQVRLQWARYQLASAVLKKETTQASLSLSFSVQLIFQLLNSFFNKLFFSEFEILKKSF